MSKKHELRAMTVKVILDECQCVRDKFDFNWYGNIKDFRVALLQAGERTGRKFSVVKLPDGSDNEYRATFIGLKGAISFHPASTEQEFAFIGKDYADCKIMVDGLKVGYHCIYFTNAVKDIDLYLHRLGNLHHPHRIYAAIIDTSYRGDDDKLKIDVTRMK
jgi:hypothetical protein